MTPLDLNGGVGEVILLTELSHIVPKSRHRFPARVAVNDDVGRENIVGAVHRPDMSVMRREHMLERAEAALQLSQVNVFWDGLESSNGLAPVNTDHEHASGERYRLDAVDGG